MKYTINVTRWDVIVGKLAAATLFSPLTLILMIAFSAQITFTTSDWMRGFRSRAEIAFIGGTTMLIFIALFIAIIFALSVLQVVANTKLKYGILGEHVLEVRGDGFLESTAFNETLLKWQSLTRVRRLWGRHFIFISGTRYHLIPDRCFPSKREAIAFADAIRSRIPK